MKSSLLVALGALGSFSSAQEIVPGAHFVNMMFANGFVQNVNYTISWDFNSTQSFGPVSANLKSGNYSQPIFGKSPTSSKQEFQSANTSCEVNYNLGTTYLWTVPIIIPGSYSMELLTNGVATDESPDFQIYAAPLSTTGSVTPTIMAATGTGTGIATTPYVYYDIHCGCTKIAMAPAPSRINGAGMNYTAPQMTAPTMPQYTGAAGKIVVLSNSAAIGIALLVGAFAA